MSKGKILSAPRQDTVRGGPPPRRFVVMNTHLHYFCGFARGGALVWLDDFARAKKLDDEGKFRTLQKICAEEIAMDWCDPEPPARRPRKKQTTQK